MAARAKKTGKRYDVVGTELGSVGLKQYGGVVREEFLRELQGPRGMKVYREMIDNSAVIGAALNAIEMLARQVSWTMVPPLEATDEEKKRTDRIQASLHDMTSPWTETVASHLTMLGYGYAPHELVFKACEGEKPDPKSSSRFSDGMIAWAKIPIRPQETICRWNFDENGQTLGLYQRPPNDWKGERYIPAAKYLNFRPKAAGGNPEGRSVLRNAYFSWYFGKRIQELEGIGIERDLAGLPMFQIPAECMAVGASADLAAVFEAAKEIVQNVRNDDEAGLVIPSQIVDGKQLYDFKLLSTGGQRAVDTNKIIERLERRQAQVLLADFILLGHEGVGSFALSSDKTQLFGVALGGWLDVIADLYNLQALPQLMRVNGWPADRAPKLKHGDIEKQDIARLGDFINKMVGANIITADDNLEEFARAAADIPPRDPSSPKREPPAATNTKPFGGAPDKPKPPETNPGPSPEKAATDELRSEVLEFRREVRAAVLTGHTSFADGALALARSAVERPQAPLTVHVAPSPAPNVSVEAAAPVVVPAPVVNMAAAQAPSVIVQAAAAPDVKVNVSAPEVTVHSAVNTPAETTMKIVGPVETHVTKIPTTEEVVDVMQRTDTGAVKKVHKRRKQVRD